LGTSRDKAGRKVKSDHPELAGVVDQAKQIVQERSFDEYPEVLQAIEEMARFLNNNPRRIKRFINLYRLQALVVHRRGVLNSSISLNELARWTIINMRWPEFVTAAMQTPQIVSNFNDYIATIGKSELLTEKQKIVESLRAESVYPSSLYSLLLDSEFCELLHGMSGQAIESPSHWSINQITIPDAG
jgi:hypothetical protein